MDATTTTKKDNTVQGKEYDAVPLIAYALKAHDKLQKTPDDKGLQDSYDNAIQEITRNYGQDTGKRVMQLNSKLRERGSADLDKSLYSISKSSLASNLSNQHLKNFFKVFEENPDTLNKFTYAFNLPDKQPEQWTKDLAARIEKHGEHDVIVPHKEDIPFNVVMVGDKRKVIPKGVMANTVDVKSLPDLHMTDYNANITAIKNK